MSELNHWFRFIPKKDLTYANNFGSIIGSKMEVIILKPVIAIPLAGRDPFRNYMNSKYVQSLDRAGAKAYWIELGDPDIIEKMLLCDGLLLPGGGDMDPKYYGQVPTEKCGKPFPLRDTVELKMLEAFLPTGKPFLGICRGEQVLNVFCGGTLLQDIKGIQRCSHSDNPCRYKGIHRVTVSEGSRLHDILGLNGMDVNSMHHQVVDAPGIDLIVSAVSEDGFAEAVEMPSHPFCIGVQWHPEHMSKRSRRQRRIFDAFVSACK